MKHYFTSESVTEGHPDKLCDRISDAVLDKMLEKDPMSRVACEVTATTGLVMVMGEITANCQVDVTQIARDTIREIGYDKPEYGFDAENCAVLNCIQKQSPDIAMGVDESYEAKAGGAKELGAGDQGLMFGYACDETPELMPLPISLAHTLARKLTAVRKMGELTYLRPDGKTQVTVEYDGDTPKRVEAVVVSTQHDPEISIEALRADVLKHVILPVIPAQLMDADTKIFINPTGRFVIGGPHGDTGLTGRKIIVDTYGGYARHGGGALSGKDATKVDRTAAYMMRYVAKNIVAAGLAKKCELQAAYAIGVARPVSLRVDTFGTGIVDEETLTRAVEKLFDLRPDGMIQTLGLRRPLYAQTAAYGHFGNEAFPWEKTDMVDALKKEVLGV